MRARDPPGCGQTPTSLATRAAEEPAPSLGTAAPLAPGTPAVCCRYRPLLASPAAFSLGQADAKRRRPTPSAAERDLRWVLQRLDEEPPTIRLSCRGSCSQHGERAAPRAAPRHQVPVPPHRGRCSQVTLFTNFLHYVPEADLELCPGTPAITCSSAVCPYRASSSSPVPTNIKVGDKLPRP